MATSSSTNNGYSSQGVSSLIGLDAYQEILSHLPDEFYDRENEGRWKVYWDRVREEIIHGNRDVEKLAKIYQTSYNRINQESVK